MNYRIIALALVGLGQQTLAAEKAEPRRIESGELRANYRTFDHHEPGAVIDRRMTINSCQQDVRIGDVVRSEGGIVPLRPEARSVVIGSTVAVFCGI